MKNKRKFLVLILALTMMCLCLTGCDELDTMREKHAFFVEEDNADAITYNGETYLKIEKTGNLPDPLYNNNDYSSVYVTNPDVPVLLSQSLGNWLDISADGNFLYGYIYTPFETEYSGVYESSVESLYVKDEFYDTVKAKIEEGIEYPMYGYSYYVYEDEDDFEGTSHYYYLNSDEIAAINKVIEEVKPTDNEDVIYDYYYVLNFDKVSADKFFGMYSYELYYNKYDGYYLSNYSESLDTHSYYKVPESMTEIFDEISSHCNGNAYGDPYIENYAYDGEDYYAF
ncbi:MAG: hypothetical protein IJE16_03150 [Ruminococcus sp.]|nr:hypothetical protein [Ruminococcus sp.]